MNVVLTQDVDKLGLRGDVVNVARGYARNFLLPRGLAEVATPGLVKELEKRDAQRARHEAKTVDEAQRDREACRRRRASVRRERRPDGRPLRLGHGDERRRPALGRAEAPRRPPQAPDGDDQAHRALHRPVRGVRGRRRRDPPRRRAGRPGAPARSGARGARGGRAGRGSRRGRGRSRRGEQATVVVEEAIAEEDEAGRRRGRPSRIPRKGKSRRNPFVHRLSTGLWTTFPSHCPQRRCVVWNSPGSWRKVRAFRPLY